VHLLIGTDGSDHARLAAERAVALLARPDRVTLITVGSPPMEESAGLESGFAGGVADPNEVAIAWAAVEARANQVLEEARDAIAAHLPDGTPIDVRVEYGSPGPDLCRIAEEVDADVVAVGSRGQGAIRRALLGSVSSHVVHNAPCAVLVIRSETT
jgi:nucleotide-binding universal stress UspA family protein